MIRSLRVVAGAGLIVAALAAAGCGTGGLGKGGDASRGKDLFVKGANGKQSCGSCHTLAAAATSGTLGPNLDDAFGPSRAQGFKESTIREVVLHQIQYPSCVVPTNPQRCMPANLLTGGDAQAVAAYVASVAGKTPAGGAATTAPPPPPPATTATTPTATEEGGGAAQLAAGKKVFTTAGCTSCHTLADAGSKGTVGPNLDEAKPSKDKAIERVTNGKGAMPSFKGQLSPEQIEAVATYVSTVTRG